MKIRLPKFDHQKRYTSSQPLGCYGELRVFPAVTILLRRPFRKTAPFEAVFSSSEFNVFGFVMTHMTQWKPRSYSHAAVLVGMFAIALAWGGCAPEEDPELSGSFGSGDNGTAVNADTVVEQTLSTSSGTEIGSISYDSSYFVDVSDGEESEAALTLVSAVDALALSGSTISGRPDTPCRFTAAIMARDEDFEILRSGDRTNSTGLDFHQVDLSNGQLYRSVYCATLKSEIGILILAEGDGANLLTSEQTLYVLNSIQGLD